MTIIC